MIAPLCVSAKLKTLLKRRRLQAGLMAILLAGMAWLSPGVRAEDQGEAERAELEKLERLLRARGALPKQGNGQSEDEKPLGLTVNGEGAYEGLVLFSPLRETSAFLMNTNGTIEKAWTSAHRPGLGASLTANGGLLRTASVAEREESTFAVGAGAGGLLQMFDPSGNLVWEYDGLDGKQCFHHDVKALDNGNVLAIAWVEVSGSEAIKAGRRPQDVFSDRLWYTRLVEIEPMFPTGGNVVWGWDAWDHIVQETDPDKPNFGDPRENPHKIDLNYFRLPESRASEAKPRRAPGSPKSSSVANVGEVDWMHANSVDVHPLTGHVIVSVHGFDEIWVIDRERPGDGLAYRFGNPSAYGAGEFSQRYLFRQHDANWIPETCPGGGNVLLFNNGTREGPNSRSKVMEFRLPLENGKYRRNPDGSFEEPDIVWVYSGTEGDPLRALRMSGAQRLPNGNTFISHGPDGRLMQVNREGEVVWEYWNEFGSLTSSSRSSMRTQNAKSLFKAWMYPMPAIGSQILTPVLIAP